MPKSTCAVCPEPLDPNRCHTAMNLHTGGMVNVHHGCLRAWLGRGKESGE